MPIPDSVLGRWSHHYSASASIQAHLSIRDALDTYTWHGQKPKFDVFLQGSYKNDTNLRLDSDVDVVVQLDVRLRPRVATLSGPRLEQDQDHKVGHQRWQSFRRQILDALRARFGDAVTTGRKSLKVSKGQIPASADVVPTVRHETGLAFYLPDEHRWVVSYPQQHYGQGLKKEQATGGTYKRTIRMFKTARNQLVEDKVISSRVAPSYFIECLLFNVPDRLFGVSMGQTYCDIVDWLSSNDFRVFKSQNGVQRLFGQSRDQWNADRAGRFVSALTRLWNGWS